MWKPPCSLTLAPRSHFLFNLFPAGGLSALLFLWLNLGMGRASPFHPLKYLSLNTFILPLCCAYFTISIVSRMPELSLLLSSVGFADWRDVDKPMNGHG